MMTRTKWCRVYKQGPHYPGLTILSQSCYYNEVPIITPPFILIKSGLNSKQVSLMKPFYIEKCILVLKQDLVVLLARTVLITELDCNYLCCCLFRCRCESTALRVSSSDELLSSSTIDGCLWRTGAPCSSYYIAREVKKYYYNNIIAIIIIIQLYEIHNIVQLIH